MLREQLLELDFTQNQADVYLALLELGQTKVGPIISKTGFHRNIVYRALEDLIARKLVYRITKRGVAYFEIANPESLVHEIDQKKIVAEDVIKQISNKKGISQSEVFIYSGLQGIIDTLNEMLQQGEDFYLIGANGFIWKRYPEWWRRFEDRRCAKKIRKLQLAVPEIQKSEYADTPLTQTKYLTQTFPYPIVIWIFGQTVAHVLWEQPETIFLMNNKKLADQYREYFKLLWNQDSWVLKGKQGFLDLLKIIADTGKDLHYLNATGGGLKKFPEEYKQWMRDFSSRGLSSLWLTMPDFDTDISNIGTNHKLRRLKTKISSPTVYWIFGDYIANVLWEENMPFIFLLKNKSITQSYREYFDYLWKHGSVPFSQKVN